jgi:hypothetical protein
MAVNKKKVAKNPDAAKKMSDKRIAQAEQAFRDLMNSGKVTNIIKAKEMIAKKYGVYPVGYTN